MSLEKRVREWCDRKIKIGQTSQEDFIEAIQEKGFAYAFTWSMGKVDEIARADVAKYVLEVFESTKENKEFRLEAWIQYQTDQCLRRTQYPERSTSITSNLMATAQNAAWAEFCSQFSPRI